MSATTLDQTTQTLIPKDGWRSFSSEFPDPSQAVATELFDRYAKEVAAESTKPLSENEISIILVRNLRDLFMAYSILRNEKGLAEVLELSRLFSMDPELTFGDINEMLEADFDPFCFLNARLYLRKMVDQPQILTTTRHRLNGFPDQEGDQLEEVLDFKPLRLYRTLFHLKRMVPGIKQMKPSFKAGEAINLPSKIYFGALLKHHAPLIENVTDMFNLFFQTPKGGNPNLNAAQVHDILVKGSSKVAKAKVKELQYLKKCTAKTFFPTFTFPTDLQSPEPIPPVDLHIPFSSSGQKKKRLYQQFLEDPRISMLPACYRKGVIAYQVSAAYQSHKQKPAKVLAKLFNILMQVFRQSDSKEQFLTIIPPIVHHINLLSYELSKKSTGFINAWERMLVGSLSRQELASMMNQLNGECTRLFRSLNIHDLCDHLDKFLPETRAATTAVVRPSLRRSHKQYEIKAPPKIAPTPVTASSSQSFSVVQDKRLVSVKVEPATKSSSCPDLMRSQSVMYFSPNQLTLDQISNRITDTIVFHLLAAKDDKTALKIAVNAINFAIVAIEGPVANFHVARSVYFAFCRKAVSRLKFLQSSLTGEGLKNFNRLQELFAPTGNFSNFREAMRNCDRPFIPHLGLYKSDFTFGTETEETDSQKKLVQEMVGNFEKLTALLKVAVPIVPPCSDCVEFLNTFKFDTLFTRPDTKIDFDGIEDWKEGEWESLPSDEKTWFVSTNRWPPPGLE